MKIRIQIDFKMLDEQDIIELSDSENEEEISEDSKKKLTDKEAEDFTKK